MTHEYQALISDGETKKYINGYMAVIATMCDGPLLEVISDQEKRAADTQYLRVRECELAELCEKLEGEVSEGTPARTVLITAISCYYLNKIAVDATHELSTEEILAFQAGALKQLSQLSNFASLTEL